MQFVSALFLNRSILRISVGDSYTMFRYVPENSNFHYCGGIFGPSEFRIVWLFYRQNITKVYRYVHIRRKLLL